jgi:DNA (cytosine-5)-methyltransferase 1
MQKLKAVSLYSGADNLGDGLFQAGHEVIMAVEYYPKNPAFSKDACATIKENHPDTEVICKPVSEILSTLPKCDILIGGPPCPEFSRANSDRTFDLCEVDNFNKAREITGAKHHIMENVQDLYKVYKEKSYLINAADYGVPQTRIRRIFTDLELPTPSHAEFPTERLFGESIKKWISVRKALNLNGVIEDRSNTFNEQSYRQYSTDRTSHTITCDVRDWYISSSGFTNGREIGGTKTIDEPCYTVVCADDIILSNYTNRQRFNENKQQRKLTNKELAILQGFRKDFKFVGSKTNIKRMIGNAVPSQISKAFMEHSFKKD